jgi:hypothetical protein
MQSLELLLLALFTWRLAYLLVKESGPFNLMGRLRAKTTFGGLLDCIYCASVWTALIGYVLLSTPLVPVVYVGAASGGAMMLWRYTGGEHG